MNNVWWAIVRFFQKLFVPPELTAFERFLVNQVSHLEAELNKERERSEELYHRLLFGNNRPEPTQESPISVAPPNQKIDLERDRLERLSKQRWEAHIAEMAERAKFDAKASEQANAEAQRQSKSSGLQDAH